MSDEEVYDKDEEHEVEEPEQDSGSVEAPESVPVAEGSTNQPESPSEAPSEE